MRALKEEVFPGTNKETILWSPDENQVDARTISKECESIKMAAGSRPACAPRPDFQLGRRLKRSSADDSWDSREGKQSILFRRRPFAPQLRHVGNVFMGFYIHNGTVPSPEGLGGWIICHSQANHQ